MIQKVSFIYYIRLQEKYFINLIKFINLKGFIYVWNIENYNLLPKYCLDESSPQCVNSWRAHDSTITSIEYIGNSDGAYSGQLLLTASTDCCCRLWTLNGMYIGVFGQNNRWNLNNSKIFQSSYKSNFKTKQSI